MELWEGLGFDERSFLNPLLGFAPSRNFKPTNAVHADFPGVYICDKILNLSTKDKIHIKCDVIDGSVVDGSRQPLLYSLY